MEPKIRLKEFSGDWNESRLNSFLTPSCSKNRDGKFTKEDVLSVSGEFGIVNQIALKGRSFAGVSVLNYGVVENKDIVYTKSPLRTNPYGIIKANEGVAGIVSTLYAIYKSSELTDSTFVQYYFESDSRLNSYLRPLVRKGAKNDMKVSAKDALLGNVRFPSYEEEQAIAEFFKQLDSLLQSTTKKIESLKQVKAASLQSMFPQEGETTPRVRFKGFEGDWKKKMFAELYEPSSVKNRDFGADKIISVANMYFKPVSYISDEEYLKSYNVMNLGDIAFEGNKSKNYAHGRFVENTIGDGIVSHVFIVLKPINKQYDLQFWKYLINYERIMGPVLLRSTKHSTMMTDLVVSDFLKESVLVPSYEEQKVIGAFLQNLDSQISLQTQRLEKLKQIKSACLDNMFV